MTTDITPDEIIKLDDMISKMLDNQIKETLERLAKRELELLKEPGLGGDPEMREITLWNVAALAAASNLINLPQKDLPIVEKHPDPPTPLPIPEG